LEKEHGSPVSGSDVTGVLVVKGLEVAVPPVLRIGLADSFSEKYGLPEELVRACRLMLAQIAARTFKSLKVKDKLA
jgi:hypothetical protein